MSEGGRAPERSLVCPQCERRVSDDGSRFCAGCGMPLTIDEPAPERHDALSEARRRARKIDPRYAEGELVRVAGGRHQAEAEMIQGILLEEGVPSMLRRSAGFDVPDFLAAGPRDVFVPASGAIFARELLHQSELGPQEAPPLDARAQARLALRLGVAVLAGGAVTALITWLLLEATP